VVAVGCAIASSVAVGRVNARAGAGPRHARRRIRPVAAGADPGSARRSLNRLAPNET
jgi:hypothetical protein